ncbi:MAG: hypothetical protein RMZ43_002925 [Nostoc sp. CmiVER01]|uniref:hypothetical protein n=1 Tax=Nostoc sp. CmiVER01 TaxID=3075384 RepID=UPI002AD52686|nr:hypothetical protein [Nostoc sp. CmiVER01]MDZ8124758.1 hypothetical protein [Nostoc sp. CmiVER01]
MPNKSVKASNSINITLTPYTVVWRYQGDIQNGNILDAKLELLMQKEYRDEKGEVYKIEPLTTISGTPEELGFLEEFKSVQTKLAALTSQLDS